MAEPNQLIEKIIPHDRLYDIIVFGASGYTGVYVVEELAKHGGNFKYAIAGRNREKLENVLKNLASARGDVKERQNIEDIDIIIADVHDKKTIDDMCKQTALVISCVGPYRFFGEPVVRGCVENSTHYVDVSGEPQFLEEIQVKYFEEARNKKIYIVGACGFDSVPCDLGIQILKYIFDGDVNSVETFLHLENKSGIAGNFATWQSAIYGLAHASELVPIRKQLKENIFKKTIPKSNFPARRRRVLFKRRNTWCIPFIGSDKSVVKRTQHYNFEFCDERPVQVQTYFCQDSLFYALGALVIGLVFSILVKFSYGRYLLEKYPGFFSGGTFSKASPQKEEPSSGGFSLTFEAEGWADRLEASTDQHSTEPDKFVMADFIFPDAPYITTALCVVSCAFVLLTEPENVSPQAGGVFTPAVAFNNTTLPQRLEARGVFFEATSPCTE